jgi:hypothetical protein
MAFGRDANVRWIGAEESENVPSLGAEESEDVRRGSDGAAHGPLTGAAVPVTGTALRADPWPSFGRDANARWIRAEDISPQSNRVMVE